jgi:multidrug transporter EmrE-like cation transporter
MTYLQYLLGFALYVCLASVSYSETLKLSKWYLVIGALGGILTNVLWLLIAKSESNSSSLMLKALIWDSMIVITYLIIPIIFFNAKLSSVQVLGILLILSGMLLTKI